MSSSIKTGLEALKCLETDLAAVLITLCDQPLITGEFLRRFITAFEQTEARVIAADYGEFAGVPALFSREMFHALYGLTGDKGAREIIRREESLTTIPLGCDGADIDEPEHIKSTLRMIHRNGGLRYRKL
jgi:molybdenum cofactor cytidylyltransferase